MIKAWIAAGIAGLLLLAGLAVQTARLDAAKAREAVAAQAARDNAAVVTRMQADAAHAARLVAEYAAEIAALQERTRHDQAAILRAPSARCADLPACDVALRQLRARRAAPQAPGQDPAGGVGAALPGPTAGASP